MSHIEYTLQRMLNLMNSALAPIQVLSPEEREEQQVGELEAHTWLEAQTMELAISVAEFALK
jgi:hypothetical protein